MHHSSLHSLLNRDFKRGAHSFGQAVADQVPSELLKQGLLYPLQSNILEAEIQTAARVAKLVFDSGLARVDRPTAMVAFIREQVYKPEYANEAAG